MHSTRRASAQARQEQQADPAAGRLMLLGTHLVVVICSHCMQVSECSPCAECAFVSDAACAFRQTTVRVVYDAGTGDCHQGFAPDRAVRSGGGKGPLAPAAPRGSAGHVAACSTICLWYQGASHPYSHSCLHPLIPFFPHSLAPA